MLYGSKVKGLLFIRSVIVPPYCGVPRLSHQFPVTVVVVGEVVVAVVTVVIVLVLVVVVFVAVVVDVGVDVDVFDVAQDVSIIAATIKKLKPNHTSLFFNY
jgi:hypothetical protein